MAVTPTKWNSADKAAGTTLSASDLRASNAGGSVRSVFGAVSGKYYWEYKFPAGTGQMVGVATSSANIDTWPGADSGGWAWERATGSIYSDGVVIYSGTAGATTVGVLLDATAKTVQFRRNNVNIGPPISLTGTQFFAISGWFDDVTANFGATAFTYAVPAGYEAGFGPTVGAPAALSSSVTLDDAYGKRLTAPSIWSPTDKDSSVTLVDPQTLTVASGASGRSGTSVASNSGNWYWEYTLDSGGQMMVGLALSNASLAIYPGGDDRAWAYDAGGGSIYHNGVPVPGVYGAAAGSVIGVALNTATKEVQFYVDGVPVSGVITVTGTSWFAMGGYIGTAVANFGATQFRYSPPPGYNLGFGAVSANTTFTGVVTLDDLTQDAEIAHTGGTETIDLDGYGVDSAEFGVTTLEQGTYVIEPYAWESSEVSYYTAVDNEFYLVQVDGWENDSAVGGPTIAEGERRLEAFGFDATEWGDATIQDRYIYVDAPGIAPPPDSGPASERQVPSPVVDFRTRNITEVGDIEPEPISEDHSLTHWVQSVDIAGLGYFDEQIGDTVIDYGTRELYPFPIVGPSWGANIIYRKVVVEPTGWVSDEFSDNAELLINTRRVYHHSGVADPAGYGTASFMNWTQRADLHNFGWVSTFVEFPIIYNSTREIAVGPFADNLPPDTWTNYAPYVDNQWRVVTTFGHQSSRFGISTLIYNNAVPVFAGGDEFTVWGAETFISHRHRTVAPHGWDSFYTTVYSVVWLGADVIGPATLGDQSEFGKPDPVLNLNRDVKQHSGWEGAIWGVPFVAPRVRTILSGLFYDVAPSYPEVRHNPYPIAPAGIPWQGQVGGHEALVFKREVFPKPMNVTQFPRIGEATVRNRNITVAPYAYEQTTFGVQDIQNFIRYISPVWLMPDLVPPPLIEYRTKTIHPAPVQIPEQGVLHRVRNLLPDPPSTQYLILSRTGTGGQIEDGDGIPPERFDHRPDVYLATIFPEGFLNSRFGLSRVWSTTLETEIFGSTLEFGTPTIIFTQYIYPDIFEPDYWQVPTGARLSPFTIYAPSGDEAPEGYHPQPSGDVIDKYLPSWDQSEHPWFGQTNVTHQHRSIGPVPDRYAYDPDGAGFDYYPKYGNATFTLRRQYVLLDGIRSLRMGFPVLWGVPQFVDLGAGPGSLGDGIPPLNEFGATDVAVPIELTQYIDTWDNDLTLWGDSAIDLKNRTIEPTGIDHQGGSSGPDPWGDALVGFPRVYYIGMGVQTIWGDNIIEYKNRPVFPEGWNSCTLESWDFENYKFPMKVIRKNPLVSPASMGDVAVFGTCTVSQRVRTVYSRGVDSYNSGSHSVKASYTIGAQGWESLLIGDIDRWEAGKIKAHGDDMSEVGIPRLLHPLRASGFDSGVVAASRIAPVLSPIGIPNIAFDGPSVTNPFGCTNRVVTPLPILSNQTVPSPVVA